MVNIIFPGVGLLFASQWAKHGINKRGFTLGLFHTSVYIACVAGLTVFTTLLQTLAYLVILLLSLPLWFLGLPITAGFPVTVVSLGLHAVIPLTCLVVGSINWIVVQVHSYFTFKYSKQMYNVDAVKAFWTQFSERSRNDRARINYFWNSNQNL